MIPTTMTDKAKQQQKIQIPVEKPEELVYDTSQTHSYIQR